MLRIRRLISFALANPLPLVVLAIVVSTILKLLVAANTHGTDDVRLFHGFAIGIKKFGWIRAYGEHMASAQYNHPPLTGMTLVAINWIRDVFPWIPFEFLIRLPAIFADVVTVWLVFRLVQTYRSINVATISALLVATSPVLFVISGFHGNTDPVFVMLTMLSLYLLTVRHLPPLAGLALAMALSVKLVAIVVVPLLVFIAIRAGWRSFLWFTLGGAAFMLPTWLPVIFIRWTEYKENVFEYAGVGSGWGVVQGLRWLGVPEHFLTEQVSGPGRFVVLVVAMALPVLLAWRRPAATVPAFGLAYVLFLMLSTAHAMQYMAWAAAPAILVSLPAGFAYQIGAGLLVIKVYDHWNKARPWNWDYAYADNLSRGERFLAILPWLTLLAATLTTLLYFRSARSEPGVESTDASPDEAEKPEDDVLKPEDGAHQIDDAEQQPEDAKPKPASAGRDGDSLTSTSGMVR